MNVQNYVISQKSGKIINICSLFSFLGGLGSPVYADELGKYNIQVNGIAPGYYATDITTTTRSNPETNKKVLDHIPAERWRERQDLVNAKIPLQIMKAYGP